MMLVVVACACCHRVTFSDIMSSANDDAKKLWEVMVSRIDVVAERIPEEAVEMACEVRTACRLQRGRTPCSHLYLVVIF